MSSALGQALVTIVSAMAQLERDLIRERVSAGIRNARANGKKLGRPMRAVDRERILGLKAQGHSLREIAAKLGWAMGPCAKGSSPRTSCDLRKTKNSVSEAGSFGKLYRTNPGRSHCRAGDHSWIPLPGKYRSNGASPRTHDTDSSCVLPYAEPWA